VKDTGIKAILQLNNGGGWWWLWCGWLVTEPGRRRAVSSNYFMEWYCFFSVTFSPLQEKRKELTIPRLQSASDWTEY
jgi:hypothetical protein